MEQMEMEEKHYMEEKQSMEENVAALAAVKVEGSKIKKF